MARIKLLILLAIELFKGLTKYSVQTVIYYLDTGKNSADNQVSISKRIIYFGGPSASGKSTVATKISKKIGYPVVRLDNYFSKFKMIFGEEFARQAMRIVAPKILDHKLKKNSNYIVEGSWISPGSANQLIDKYGEKIQVIYFGYPKVDINNLYRLIRKKGRHWLSRESPEEAKEFLEYQIMSSRWYRMECRKYEIKFVDFTDKKKGTIKVLTYFDNFATGI